MVDELMEAYVGWREACAHLEDAHRRWRQARRRDAAQAYERCAAALEEEGRAAAWYAAAVRRAEEVFGAGSAAITLQGSPAGRAGSS
jgi:hypothetical protein